MATTDGGAAFPRPSKLNPDEVSGDQSGMSLRDWFAGQALAGLTGKMGWSGTERGREMAQWCYYMGSIMVEVGEGGKYTDWAALIEPDDILLGSRANSASGDAADGPESGLEKA